MNEACSLSRELPAAAHESRGLLAAKQRRDGTKPDQPVAK
jgi:hypothetical protein